MNKKTILIILVAMIGLVIWLWPKKTTEKSGIDQIKNDEELVDLSLPMELLKPTKIDWSGVLVTEGVDSIVNKTKRRDFAKTDNEKIMGLIDGGLKISKEDEGKIYFGNEKRGGFIDKKNELIEYQENITSKEQIKTGGSFNIDKGKKIVEEIVSLYGGNYAVSWQNKKYIKIVYPQWIETTENKAELLEIWAKYVINGREIESFTEPMVKLIINQEGRIINLKLRLAMEEVVEEEKVKERAWNEVIDGRKENIVIGRSDNPIEKTELANRDIKVIMSTKVDIFNPRTATLKSFWRMEGSAFLGGKPVRLVMYSPAYK